MPDTAHIKFKDKFIGYVDILGFKELVGAAENGGNIALSEILELLGKFGSVANRERFERNGPMQCTASRFVQRDLDFRGIQISDCLILSAEVSPAGGINLIERAWMGVTELLTRGILCRGYITRGNIYHTDTQVIGTGYQKALDMESKGVTAFHRNADEQGTPFVEIDPTVMNYLSGCGDGCVKKMLSRLVMDDGIVVALFPFKCFAVQSAITDDFDAAKQKVANQNLRVSLQKMKDQVLKYLDQAKPKAVVKSEHYLAALDAQLAICDRHDDHIDAICRPFLG